MEDITMSKLSVTLTDAQQKAVELLGLSTSEDLQKLADSAVANSIRSKMNAQAETKEVEAGKAYDLISRSMKLPIAREDFVSKSMSEFDSALKNLGGRKRRTNGDTEDETEASE
jgi:hypothetical protein